jgi:hypothetical protein
MRKFGLFLCLSLLFAFTGCSDSDDVEEQGGTVLAKPSVAVTTTTSSSFKVAWDAVPNAESYKYRLSQENETGDELVVQPENSTSATALAFGDLDPKTKYILRVKAVAAAGSGLTDSEYSKIFATTLAEEAAELTFEKIAATNPTYESVDVEIVPSAENLYYWQVVENSLIEGKSDREIIAALKENISELSSGTVRKTVYGLKADTEYTVVAFGYDLDAGKSTSAVARLETAFTTPADDRMTIAITVGEVADNNVHVTFEPSVADGHYFADVVAAKDIEGKTDMEIVALLQTKYGNEMTDIARSGKFETDITVEENTNYTAVAFGYNVAASEFLTQLFRADIKNGGAEPGMSDAWADMEIFTAEYSDKTPALGADIYLNESAKSVKLLCYTLTGPASSLEQIGMTAEGLRDELIAEGGVIPDESLIEPGVYEVGTPIEFGKVYMFANVALDANGDAGEANWVIVQSQSSASGRATILGMAEKNNSGSDPGELSNAWVNMQGAYRIDADEWLIGATLFPNEETVTVRTFARLLENDCSSLEEAGLTESDLRTLLVSSSGQTIEPNKGTYQVLYELSANDVLLISTSGKDAKGNLGAANWMIVKAPATSDGKPTILGMSDKNDETGGSTEEPTPGYSQYLGTWTVTSTTSLKNKKPLTFDITIEQNRVNASYAVTGWSISSLRNEIPVLWTYERMEDGDKVYDMVMMPTQLVTEFDDSNLGTKVSLEYQPFCMVKSEKLYTPIQFPYNSELIGGAMVEGEFKIVGLTDTNVGTDSNPLVIDAYTMDFFAYYSKGGEDYVGTYEPAPGFTEDDYPVGPFTLVKKSGAAASTAKRTLSTKAVETFRIRSMSSVLRGIQVERPNRSAVVKVKELSRNSAQGRVQRLDDNMPVEVHQIDGQRIIKHRFPSRSL